jgi:sugar phosphate isomerase/epimerase
MKLYQTLLLSGAVLIGSALPAETRVALRYDWPLFIYNFGGLDKYPIEEQVNKLQGYGYAGIAIEIGDPSKPDEFDRYQAAAKRTDGFRVVTAMYRLDYVKGGFSRAWVQAVDRLAGTGTDLWLISGKSQEGLTPELLEKELREVVEYAASKSLKVTLYPHSKNMIATAEEALVYVDKINRPNFDLAVHTCHEIRGGNAARIEEVLEKVANGKAPP